MTEPRAITRKEVDALVRKGEGLRVEFKRSTSELREGMQTISAFLNTDGGAVLFGIRPEGRIEGQQISDQTLREIAQAMDRFEPPVTVTTATLPIAADRQVVVLRVERALDSVPVSYEGRPYERIGSVTRRMTQARSEELLFERAHARRRWENQPAVGVRVADLDREEILRVRELAIQQRRISADTARKPEDVLDRLGLRQGRSLTQAALVLFGTKFLPDYPQCMLKLGRFRGTNVLGDILDNRQEHMHAFAMVREGMAFLERTLPLGATFPKGRIEREDRFPVPPEAMREVLLNAVMHRDYADWGGYIAIAVFDDRVEIRSSGKLPFGITPEMLTRNHLSRPRNLLIAETFHRTGAVEIWGRGTNRVIDACRAARSPLPKFAEQQGFVIVTFPFSRTQRGGVQATGSTTVATDETPQVTPHETPQVTPHETPQVRLVLELRGEMSRRAISDALGLKDTKHFRQTYVLPALVNGLIEMTLPDRPTSRAQKYRLTTKGKRIAAAAKRERGH
ncbi:MAG: putative DNA binding domain-containing protein [Planctomycetes bacterium]|nr:putative DNA binding domain-containing protein [Planctomycetota bacterium]MCC7172452.1 putative DNA binding domain-containing protein [Planctomycetota bacterium]